MSEIGRRMEPGACSAAGNAQGGAYIERFCGLGLHMKRRPLVVLGLGGDDRVVGRIFQDREDLRKVGALRGIEVAAALKEARQPVVGLAQLRCDTGSIALGGLLVDVPEALLPERRAKGHHVVETHGERVHVALVVVRRLANDLGRLWNKIELGDIGCEIHTRVRTLLLHLDTDTSTLWP